MRDFDGMTLIAEEYLHARPDLKVWNPCNIYKSAKLGKNVSVGMFSEIGENVVIGDNVRIGASCFIPEGVTIESDCFIGPHTIFSNDKFPMSRKEQWEKTVVKQGAKIGAGCCLLPGIIIGKEVLIGMGSTVTKSVPDYQVWAGNPAKPLTDDRRFPCVK